MAMANPEHVEFVKRGAAAIKEWRKEHPEGTLDLLQTNFLKANLSGADLYGANLSLANLSGRPPDDAWLSSLPTRFFCLFVYPNQKKLVR